MKRELKAIKPVEFLLLLSLADGPLHGYGLVGRIEEESDGRVRLFPGNLYAVLRRLSDRGWIRESARPVPEDQDQRRRYYELTAEGRRALAAEARHMARLVDAVRARRLLDPTADTAQNDVTAEATPEAAP